MQNPRKYPYYDCVWIAQDASQALGAFVTGGQAPVPEQLLGDVGTPILEIEKSILQQPVICEVTR